MIIANVPEDSFSHRHPMYAITAIALLLYLALWVALTRILETNLSIFSYYVVDYSSYIMKNYAATPATIPRFA